MQEAAHTTMKRTVTMISAVLLTTALSTPLMAQMAVPPPVNTSYGMHHPNVEGFDNYLDKHPGVDQELRRDPRLIDDPAYQAKHPELRDYMHEHPHEAEAFRQHPDRFMHRERVYDRGVERWDKHHHHPE